MGHALDYMAERYQFANGRKNWHHIHYVFCKLFDDELRRAGFAQWPPTTTLVSQWRERDRNDKPISRNWLRIVRRPLDPDQQAIHDAAITEVKFWNRTATEEHERELRMKQGRIRFAVMPPLCHEELYVRESLTARDGYAVQNVRKLALENIIKLLKAMFPTAHDDHLYMAANGLKLNFKIEEMMLFLTHKTRGMDPVFQICKAFVAPESPFSDGWKDLLAYRNEKEARPPALMHRSMLEWINDEPAILIGNDTSLDALDISDEDQAWNYGGSLCRVKILHVETGYYEYIDVILCHEPSCQTCDPSAEPDGPSPTDGLAFVHHCDLRRFDPLCDSTLGITPQQKLSILFQPTPHADMNGFPMFRAADQFIKVWNGMLVQTRVCWKGACPVCRDMQGLEAVGDMLS